MAGSESPRIAQLQRPEPLHEVLAKDKLEDCLPCRITGKTTTLRSHSLLFTMV